MVAMGEGQKEGRILQCDSMEYRGHQIGIENATRPMLPVGSEVD